jgi:hypothetical protein
MAMTIAAALLSPLAGLPSKGSLAKSPHVTQKSGCVSRFGIDTPAGGV